MITLLSPAKKLKENVQLDHATGPAGQAASVGAGDDGGEVLEMTRPRLDQHMRAIAKVAKTQSADDLKRLMHISDKLAQLNQERFKAFDLDGRSNSALPAGLTFDGDVYWGLEARSLAPEILAYAQDHLRILSGLYGLLRPLDAIQPYRLEMGTSLANPRGKNLYEFWGSTISDQLMQDLDDHGERTIVNLASNEYFKAVDQKALDAQVVTASFLNVKDGKSRRLMYYVKFARGLMARWIMENRVDRAEGLKDFDLEGYRYDPASSSDGELVFSREQPALKK